MKILAHHIDSASLPAVEAYPDSAILRDGKPFFIPEWSNSWTYTPTLAFKVGRLGKNIAKRFALRYVDAISIVLKVTPVEATETFSDSNRPTGVVTAFDGSMILGEWTQIPDNADLITISVNDISIEIHHPLDILADSIASLSKYFTLKMGDIIIPPMPELHQSTMKIDTSVKGSINNIDILKFNIK